MAQINECIPIVIILSNQMFFDSDSEEEDSPRQRNEIVKIKGYVEVVVPAMRDVTFKSHFRLSRTTFQILLQKLAPLITHDTGRLTYPGKTTLL